LDQKQGKNCLLTQVQNVKEKDAFKFNTLFATMQLLHIISIFSFIGERECHIGTSFFPVLFDSFSMRGVN